MGIFKLTTDMHRLTDVPISTGFSHPDDPEKRADKAILPCFPVSFVVAKDVTLQFQVETSRMSAVKSVLDTRVAVGGGLLCFSASGASATHNESSAVASKADSGTVTIRIPGAQILGWFCEFTPTDRSSKITDQNRTDNALDVVKFVEKFQISGTGAPSSSTQTVAAGGAQS